MEEKSNVKALFQSKKDPSIAKQLVQAVDSFCTMLKDQGLQIQSQIGEKSLRTFLSYPREKQADILSNFQSYFYLLRNIGTSLTDDRALVWSTLKYLKLRPPSNLLDFIQIGDVVEIYNQNHIQIFRNLRFFELCSYTVFDVLVNEWPSLYSRNEKITEECFLEMNETLQKGKEVEHFRAPHHILSEKFSEEKRKFVCQLGIRSPLFEMGSSSKEPLAMLATLKAIPIGNKNQEMLKGLV